MKRPPNFRRLETLPRSSLQVVAAGCVSLAAIKPQPSLAAGWAVVGLLLFAWSLWHDIDDDLSNLHVVGGFTALGVMALSLGAQIGPLTEGMSSNRGLYVGLLAAAAGVGLFARSGSLARRLSVGLAVLGFVVAAASFIAAEWNSDLGIDVYHGHRAAGDALVAGENPYTSAVTMANGSPYAEEGAVIEGYTYPPVVLLTYGLVGAFTDARLISTIAWAFVIGWLAIGSTRDHRGSEAMFAALLVSATAPVWPVIWFSSWSEPLSVVLFLLAALAWKTSPVKSGLALGLAIASKQYFVFLLPFLVLAKTSEDRRRALVASVVGVATVLPFLIIDPGAFVKAIILNPSGNGLRPDSQSIPGLLAEWGTPFYPPVWLWLLAGLVVAIALSRGVTDARRILERSALLLGVVFLVGPAFPNYWFMVFGLMALAISADPHVPSTQTVSEA